MFMYSILDPCNIAKAFINETDMKKKIRMKLSKVFKGDIHIKRLYFKPRKYIFKIGID